MKFSRRETRLVAALLVMGVLFLTYRFAALIGIRRDNLGLEDYQRALDFARTWPAWLIGFVGAVFAARWALTGGLERYAARNEEKARAAARSVSVRAKRAQAKIVGLIFASGIATIATLIVFQVFGDLLPSELIPGLPPIVVGLLAMAVPVLVVNALIAFFGCRWVRRDALCPSCGAFVKEILSQTEGECSTCRTEWRVDAGDLRWGPMVREKKNAEKMASAALRKAIDEQDADGVEEALNGAFKKGLSPNLIPISIELLELPWHTRHEDTVRALQVLKPPEAVGALHRTAVATHEYLEYDEFFELARKCTWALADIGTQEAKAALQELASVENETIAGYARKRLDNWEHELDRKGGNEPN